MCSQCDAGPTVYNSLPKGEGPYALCTIEFYAFGVWAGFYP